MSRFDFINEEAARAVHRGTPPAPVYARRARTAPRIILCGRIDCPGRLGDVASATTLPDPQAEGCLIVWSDPRAAPLGHQLHGSALVPRPHPAKRPVAHDVDRLPLDYCWAPPWPLTMECPNCGRSNRLDPTRLSINPAKVICRVPVRTDPNGDRLPL